MNSFRTICDKDIERFWLKVDRNGPTAPGMESPCWIWTASCNKSTKKSGGGYGYFKLHGKCVRAHILSLFLVMGKYPGDGLMCDHLCNVRNCVNPFHIKLTTNKENTLRGNSPSAVNARKEFCNHGHPLSGDNLYSSKNRRCRICNQNTLKAYYQRKRAMARL